MSPIGPEQAREWLEVQLELLAELRNTGARDPAFKQWRQSTLAVIQRIWPRQPKRLHRFRKIPFTPPSVRAEERESREIYEKALAEARRLLHLWISEIDLRGVLASGEGAGLPESQEPPARGPGEAARTGGTGHSPRAGSSARRPHAAAGDEPPTGLRHDRRDPSSAGRRETDGPSRRQPDPAGRREPHATSRREPHASGPGDRAAGQKAAARPARPPAKPSKPRLKDMLGLADWKIDQPLPPEGKPRGRASKTERPRQSGEPREGVARKPQIKVVRSAGATAPGNRGAQAARFPDSLGLVKFDDPPRSGATGSEATSGASPSTPALPVDPSPPDGAEFPPLPDAPTHSASDPAAAAKALGKVATSLESAGVPEDERVVVRASLLELAKHIENETTTLRMLMEAAVMVEHYPALGARAMPIIRPFLDVSL